MYSSPFASDLNIMPQTTGTLAAAIQDTIGNVAAGSVFAVCQSVAMGGALPALGYAAGAATGAAALGRPALNLMMIMTMKSQMFTRSIMKPPLKLDKGRLGRFLEFSKHRTE